MYWSSVRQNASEGVKVNEMAWTLHDEMTQAADETRLETIMSRQCKGDHGWLKVGRAGQFHGPQRGRIYTVERVRESIAKEATSDPSPPNFVLSGDPSSSVECTVVVLAKVGYEVPVLGTMTLRRWSLPPSGVASRVTICRGQATMLPASS